MDPLPRSRARHALALLMAGMGALAAAGCAHGLDRTETSSSASLTASSERETATPTALTAKATLVRACRTAEPDPRMTSDYARSCAKNDPDGCLHLGIAHLCGANGSENGVLAMELFEKTCQLEDDRGCLLLKASRVVWSRPSAVVSLLDESAL